MDICLCGGDAGAKCIGLADVFPTTAGHLLINAGIEEEQAGAASYA
jgi:hypothetical protein